MTSSGSQSVTSGCCRTSMAVANPAFSNDSFQASIPSRIGCRYRNGTVFSIQNTIGFFGGDTAAVGSAFSRCQRFT
ncbi:MAG: hypothetical protein EBX36_06720 [Planctomycetia bacterium]|nr:hypothetical protein [Planctomycetia bacterium]